MAAELKEGGMEGSGGWTNGVGENEVRWVVWTEGREVQEDTEVMVAEGEGWVTSPRKKEHGAPGRKPQAPTSRVQIRGV